MHEIFRALPEGDACKPGSQAWGQACLAETGTGMQTAPGSPAHLDLTPQPRQATLAIVPCSSRSVELHLQLCNLIPHLAARLVRLLQLPQARRLAGSGRRWVHNSTGEKIFSSGGDRVTVQPVHSQGTIVCRGAHPLHTAVGAVPLQHPWHSWQPVHNAGLNGPAGESWLCTKQQPAKPKGLEWCSLAIDRHTVHWRALLSLHGPGQALSSYARSKVTNSSQCHSLHEAGKACSPVHRHTGQQAPTWRSFSSRRRTVGVAVA